jgi:hypothetical protein
VAANKAATHMLAIQNTVDSLNRVVSSARYASATVKIGTENGLVYESREAFDKAHPQWEGKEMFSASEAKNLPFAEKSRLRRGDQWVYIPNESKTHGEMAGKIVNGSVWGALEDIHHTQPIIQAKAYNDAIRVFKKVKTVYSPGTHIVNAGSNVAWAYLHDIPLNAVVDGIKLYYKATVRPTSLTPQERAVWRAFQKSGALLADHSAAELRKEVSDAAIEAMRSVENPSIWEQTKFFMTYEKAKASSWAKRASKVDEVLTDMYAAEDNSFRLAAFMSEVATLREADKRNDKTRSDEDLLLDAGRFAQEAFLDYSIHARGINIAKQTVIPFISWPYRALPAMAKIALTKPWKLGGLIGAYALLDAVLVAATGGDDEDEERRSKLPEYMQQRMFTFGPRMFLQVPGMGDADNPVYFKFGAFVPLGDLIQDDNRNGLMGQKWFPNAFTPNGPIISTIAGAIFGIDPFTGKTLGSSTDSQWEAFNARAKFLAGQFLPPAADPKRLGETYDKVVEGKTGPLGAEYDSSIAVAKLVGLRVTQVNLPEAEFWQQKAVKAIEMEYKKEISKITRESARYPDYDPDKLYEKKQELLSRMQEKIADITNETPE